MIDSSVHFQVKYPEKLSRGILLLRALFGTIYVMIPHGFMLGIYGIGAGFLLFFSWWAILFTGKYPENWFKYMTRFMRWGLRVAAYMSFYMTDKYPPFTGEE